MDIVDDLGLQVYFDFDDFLLQIGDDAFAKLMVLAKYDQFVDMAERCLYPRFQWETQKFIYYSSIHDLLAHFISTNNKYSRLSSQLMLYLYSKSAISSIILDN